LNRLRLRAGIVVLAALRYTPAGIPVCEARLKHGGAAIEAGLERQVEFEVAAVAVGSLAEQLAAEPLGVIIDVDGFIATTSRRSQRFRVHITGYTRVSGV
jgi:primosomal replication protein N